MRRNDGRRADQLRPIEIVRGFTRMSAGSVLMRWGQTHVLCTASWVEGVPEWRKGKGSGWLTAEYDMLPGSTPQRRQRSRMRVDGRTQEIQRFIGRALRAVIDLDALGENTLQIDCDVLQADGGTRTAAVTGAYVAVHDAVTAARRAGKVARSPLTDAVAAVSAGRVKGRTLLDLDYSEDSTAEVDCNVVMSGSGRFIEIQAAGEGATFSREDSARLLRLTGRGIRQLLDAQQRALRRRL